MDVANIKREGQEPERLSRVKNEEKSWHDYHLAG